MFEQSGTPYSFEEIGQFGLSPDPGLVAEGFVLVPVAATLRPSSFLCQTDRELTPQALMVAVSEHLSVFRVNIVSL